MYILFLIIMTTLILILTFNIGILTGMDFSNPVIRSLQRYNEFLRRHFDSRQYICTAIYETIKGKTSVPVLELLKITDISHSIASGEMIYDYKTGMFSNVYEDKNPKYISPKVDWI